MNQLPANVAAAVLASLANGAGIRQTALDCGVSRETVRRYAKASGYQADPIAAMVSQAMPGCTNDERAAAAKARRLRAETARTRRRTRSSTVHAAADIQTLTSALAAAKALERANERERIAMERNRKLAAKRRKREARIVAAAKAVLGQNIGSLTEKESVIVNARLSGQTFAEAAKLVGLTDSGARLVFNRAQLKMRSSIDNEQSVVTTDDELAALIAEQTQDDHTRQIKHDPELPYSVTGASRI